MNGLRTYKVYAQRHHRIAMMFIDATSIADVVRQLKQRILFAPAMTKPHIRLARDVPHPVLDGY